MQYLTRHMEALRPLRHGDAALLPGGRFVCSDIDAGYYTKRGLAKAVEPPLAGSGHNAASAPALGVATATQGSAAELLGAVGDAGQAEPGAVETAAETSADEANEADQVTEEAAPSTLTPRRGGRGGSAGGVSAAARSGRGRTSARGG